MRLTVMRWPGAAEVEIVQSWNAEANEPMLRINRTLGFQPVQRYQGWFLPLD